jgi:predicted nucleic acid-binding protein
MHGRILGFNVWCGRICNISYRRSASLCRLVEDSYIAAIARRHNLTIATGNVKDFQRPGIEVFDPFAET